MLRGPPVGECSVVTAHSSIVTTEFRAGLRKMHRARVRGCACALDRGGTVPVCSGRDRGSGGNPAAPAKRRTHTEHGLRLAMSYCIVYL